MCHCGKQEKLSDCCGRLIEGDDLADSAESLMRSRYSAFIEKKFEYLQETQDPQTRSILDRAANEEFALAVEFSGLEILFSQEKENKAVVEFIASYRDLKTNELSKHHEVSQFRKQAGIWYYRQGKMQVKKQGKDK